MKRAYKGKGKATLIEVSVGKQRGPTTKVSLTKLVMDKDRMDYNFWQLSTITHFSITYKLANHSLYVLIQIINTGMGMSWRVTKFFEKVAMSKYGKK